jgi:hypothetical protein
VTLASTGTIDEDGGVGSITAQELTGSSSGTVTLTGTNAIAALGAFSTGGGDFALYNGAISIVDALNAGTGTVDVVSTGSIDEDSGVGSITAAKLEGSSVGGATLTGANAVGNLGDFTNTSSGGVSLTDAHALTVSGTLTNQVLANTTLTTTGAGSDLTITGTINANANYVLTTTSSGLIDEHLGTMTAGALEGSSVGGATLTGNNHFASLYGFINSGAGGISLTDAQALAVSYNPVNSGSGDLTLTTTSGGITLIAPLIAGTALGGQTVTLNSAGAIGETTIASVVGSPGPETVGTITAGKLTGYSTGGTTLTQTNDVGSITGFTNTGAGGFSFTGDPALTISTDINSGSGPLTLTTVGPSTNGIILAANLIAGSASGTQVITLDSAGTISQTGGTITGGTLTGYSTGGMTLNNANAIGKLGAFTNNTSGGIALTDSNSLSITGAVNASGQTVDLAVTGAIDEDNGVGSITAQALTGSSVGGAILTGVNDVVAIGGFTNTGAGGFSFTDDPALTISSDINSGSGPLTLTTVGPSTNGIILAASLIAGAAGGTQVITLNSAGTISQTSGTITGGILTGYSTGGATLNDANSVGALGDFTNNASGNFAFTNGNTLHVTGALKNEVGDTMLVTTGAGSDLSISGSIDSAGHKVTLTSAGTIDESSGTGTITADQVTGSATGGIALTGVNNVNKLAGFTNTGAGGFAFTDDPTLTITSDINSGSGPLTLTTVGAPTNGLILEANLVAGTSSGTQIVSLNSAGSISQISGTITGGTLTGYSTGGTSLNDVNAIGSLGNFTNTGAGGFSLTNGHALDVIGTVDSGAGDLTLTTTTGEITLNGNITAGSASGTQKITLDAAGIISEANVTITGGVLSGNAIGGISLNGANSVATLGNFSNIGSGNITLTVARTLAVTGTISNTGGNIVLTTTGSGHGMTVTGNLTSTHTISFNAAGDFIQNAGTIGSGAVDIAAGQNILIGEAAFTTLVAGRAVTNIDQAKLPFFMTSPAYQNHNFIVAQTLSLTAPQRIVIQNTGTAPTSALYAPHGFALNDSVPIAVLIGGAPQVVDIFGSLVHNNIPIGAKSFASTSEVAFAPGTNANVYYKLNGCTIHQNGTCTIVSFDFKDFEPAKLSELVLAAAQNSDDVEDDLTITGEGNDEIWAAQ